jgi:hypothetical protein
MWKENNSSFKIFIFLFVVVFLVMPFVSSCGKSGTLSPSALNIQYQVVNVSPDLGSVDLYIKFGKVNTSSYFYPSASGYFYLSAIDTPFQIRPGTALTAGAIVPSANIFNIDNILKPGLKYTLMITGLATIDSEKYILTTDTAATPTTGRGKVRFENASPRSPAFDVTANGTPAFTNVPYLAVSKYIELPAGNYDFQIYPTKTSTLLRDIPNVTIQDGRVYTLYCYGLAGHTDSLAFGSGFITNQ